MGIYKVISDDNSVRVVKRKLFAVMQYAAVMLATAFFGCFFIFLLDTASVIPRYIGYTMVGVSLIMLVVFLKYVQKLRKEDGDFIFEVNSEGIKIVPEWLEGTTVWDNPLSYVELRWDQIDRIVFAEWLLDKLLHKQRWWRKLIIFVSYVDDVSFTERIYKFNRRSPDGKVFLLTSYSPGYVDSLSLYIESFSGGKIRPAKYEEVVFDYKNEKVEVFE